MAKNDQPSEDDDGDDDSSEAHDDDKNDNEDNQNKEKLEKWSLFEGCALIDCIASYCTLNPTDAKRLIMRKGQAEEILTLTLCGRCGESATPHHKCDKCNVNMHLSCGRVIGEVKE